ncbi:MAG TPA: DnaJ C-terminal domain-containing protein, partial [Pirellulaceae bacterium]
QGAKPEPITLAVQLPAGVDDGMQIRLQGEGEPALQGGQAGDCYCVIRVRKHPLFEREGEHLYVQMPVDYTQAVLGAEVDIPTMNGPRQLKIPPGTPSGHVFRIPRMGVPHPRTGAHGDLFVRTFVEVPTRINKQQELLLRQLAEMDNAEVAPERKGFLDRLRAYFSENSPSP